MNGSMFAAIIRIRNSTRRKKVFVSVKRYLNKTSVLPPGEGKIVDLCTFNTNIPSYH